MKHIRHNQGITRFELFVVVSIAVVLFFFFVMIPCGMGNVHKRSKRISCVSQLKQIGLGMQLFANDHRGNYPWAVSTNEGGSREFTNTAFTFKHFAAASNELGTPKILSCLVDTDKKRTADFGNFSNAHLSYFVSLDSNPTSNGAPALLLSGDRNISGGNNIGSLRWYAPTSAIGFTKAIHEQAGNIGLTDGSVRQVTSQGLAEQLRVQPSPIRIALP